MQISVKPVLSAPPASPKNTFPVYRATFPECAPVICHLSSVISQTDLTVQRFNGLTNLLNFSTLQQK